MDALEIFLQWLDSVQGEIVCIDGQLYTRVHNMLISKKLLYTYFDDRSKEIEFGRSNYENGKYAILTIAFDGKVRKVLCDFIGYKQIVMEFDSIDEVIEYEKTSIYPSSPGPCLYFYHNTLVFI